MKGPQVQAGLLDLLLRAMGANDESQQGVCQEGDSGTWEEAPEVRSTTEAGRSLTRLL